MIGIVAMNKDRCIGKGNDLPWHYSADLKLFKKRTLNGTIVMGRKTWDSLPRKPLPKRDNVILTRQPPLLVGAYSLAKRVHVTDLAGLDQVLAGLPEPHFVIGGRQIYELLQDRVDQYWVTLVPDKVEDGDVFFPFALEGAWREAERNDLPEGCILLRYTRP